MRSLRFLLANVIAAGQVGVAPPTRCSWPNLRTTAENLDFAEGEVGAQPGVWLLGPDWFMPPHAPINEAKNISGPQCHTGKRCAMIHSLRSDPSVPLSFLYQDVDVTQHRGQTLIYRAFVRVDPARKGSARLLVRLHRKDCSTAFRDDMGNHPIISGSWAEYEIRAPIADDAFHMEFGVQLIGQGTVWIDQISMEYVH